MAVFKQGQLAPGDLLLPMGNQEISVFIPNLHASVEESHYFRFQRYASYCIVIESPIGTGKTCGFGSTTF